MDSNELVDFQLDAGHRLIGQLVNDGFDIVAAFWMRTAEDWYWFLYIASPSVEQIGLAESYRLLQSSLQQLQGIPLSLSDVKLVGAENPITKDVLRSLSQHSALVAKRLWGKQVGNLAIDDAYIYPKVLFRPEEKHQMSSKEIIQKVIELMQRPGVLESSTITLTDGLTFRGVPIGLELVNNSMTIKFVADHLRSPRNYPVTQIVEIE